MCRWSLIILSFAILNGLVKSAVIYDEDVKEQGLYSKSDRVTILTKNNFERNVYGRKYAQLVQFYNSYCGHCRSFYPRFRSVAYDVWPWKKVFRLGVVDCSVEENNKICRDFEVMSYPSLRYIHENFVKGNGNVGESIQIGDTADKLRDEIVHKLQSEQQMRRFAMAPSLSIATYTSKYDAVNDIPQNVRYAILVFEDTNSTVGSEAALSLTDYDGIKLRRVLQTSKLADVLAITHFPAVVAVGRNRDFNLITFKDRQDLLHAINTFLKSKGYNVPQHITEESVITEKPNALIGVNADVVYYSDLETTIKSILHTEIRKTISGESYQAFINFLEVLRDDFPFNGNQNLRNFIIELLKNIKSVSIWTPDNILVLVRSLEKKHNPYKSNASDYIGCKGSQPKYRGYSCGLWTMFHTLTVGASSKSYGEGPKVLRAMHGFITHFFGCTHCVEHFTAMASRNRLFDVKDNDKAVLWLWVSHNEVNLRLAGDITEDPSHPKIQFPSASLCSQCKMANGGWNLPQVYQYLVSYYGTERIQYSPARLADTAPLAQFTDLDLGMLSILYNLSA